MRFATSITLVSSIGFAAAQTATTSAAASSASCAAQNIVDACTAGIQDQINDCSANDWICLCNNYTNLLTCYNNCPDSNERPPVQNEVTQYCNAAAPLLSASSAAAATQSHASVAQSTASATATGTTDATSSAWGTAAAATSSHTGAADSLLAPVGGVLAVFIAAAGLL